MKYADQVVPNSPFRVRAGPTFDASKVKVSGPGVDGTPISEEVVPFMCDVTEAGVAPLTGKSREPAWLMTWISSGPVYVVAVFIYFSCNFYLNSIYS